MLPPVDFNARAQLTTPARAGTPFDPAVAKTKGTFSSLLALRSSIPARSVNSPDLRELPKQAFIAPASERATTLESNKVAAPRQPRLFSESDKALLNDAMYYVRVDTETPSPEWVGGLPEGETKNFYVARHFAKKGTDVLNGYASPDGIASGSKETVPNRQQSALAVHLRQAMGTAVVERAPGNACNQRQGATVSGSSDASSVASKLDLNTFHGQVIDKLKQTDPAWGQGKDPIVVHVVTQRRDPRAFDANTNYLAMGFQGCMVEGLQNAEKLRQSAKDFTGPKVEFVKEYQPVISRTVRSNASPMGRIIQQGVFGKGCLPKNSNVVFTDDHVQAGGALMAAFMALKAADANIVGVGTFGIHPLSANGLFDGDLQITLKNVLDQKDPQGQIEAKLQDAGIPLDALTNFEVFVLLANLFDPNNTEEVQQFQDCMAACAKDIVLPEGQADAFSGLLSAPAASAKEICEQIDAELAKVPPCVEDTQISKVIFYDYDDTLSDEVVQVYAAFKSVLGNSVSQGGLGFSSEEITDILGSEMEFTQRFESMGNSKLGVLKALIGENAQLSSRIQSRLDALATQVVADVQPVADASDIDAFITALSEARTEDGASVMGADTVSQLRRVLSNPGLAARLPVVADLLQKTMNASGGSAMPAVVAAKLLNNYFAANKEALETFSNDGRKDTTSVAAQYGFARKMLMREIEATAAQYGDIGEAGKALLDATRTPDTLIGLVSNKKDNRLARQLAGGRIAHYFDAVQGVQAMLHKNGEVAHRIPQKPHSGAMEEQWQQFPLPADFAGPVIGFGDKVTDGVALKNMHTGDAGHDSHFVYMGKQPLGADDLEQLSGVQLHVAEGETLADRQIRAKEIYSAL